LDCPVQRVESEDSEVLIVGQVATASQQELDQVGDILTENRNFLGNKDGYLASMLTMKVVHKTHEDEKGLENIEHLSCTLFVPGFNSYTDD
jgi:hypothetical protein